MTTYEQPSAVATEACPIVDPTGRSSAGRVDSVAGLGELRGRTVAVLDISKVRSDVFAAEVARGLAEDEGATITRGIAPGSSPMLDAELFGLGSEHDAAVLALADCGTCSSWTLVDAIELHRHGCRAVLVTTTAQRPMVEAMIGRLGMPDLPLVEVGEANRDLDVDEIRETARGAAADIAAALRG
jgi:hypothetical protein